MDKHASTVDILYMYIIGEYMYGVYIRTLYRGYGSFEIGVINIYHHDNIISLWVNAFFFFFPKNTLEITTTTTLRLITVYHFQIVYGFGHNDTVVMLRTVLLTRQRALTARYYNIIIICRAGSKIIMYAQH